MMIIQRIFGEWKYYVSLLKKVFAGTVSGNTSIAMKNSALQFGRAVVSKLGGLLFTIVLARLLLPEVFGLYSLALGTIIVFVSLSELGASQTLIRFLAQALKENNSRVYAIIKFLAKIKVFLVIIASFILIVSAKSIAITFYDKPIFLALLAGVLYLVFTHLTSFLQSLLTAANDFTKLFYQEIIFQSGRLLLVPLCVVLLVRYAFGVEVLLSGIILVLAFCLLLGSLFLLSVSRRKFSLFAKTSVAKKLCSDEVAKIKNFFVMTMALGLSGVFFASIDKIMLGRFVEASFIGFYTAAATLIGGLAPLLSVASGALYPLFSTIDGPALRRAVKKSRQVTIVLSCVVVVLAILFAPSIISLVFGSSYDPAMNIFRLLTPILLFLPLINLYSSLHLSQGNPKIVVVWLSLSTTCNIVLNYVFISFFLPFGSSAVVYGVGLATIISQAMYLFALVINKSKQK